MKRMVAFKSDDNIPGAPGAERKVADHPIILPYIVCDLFHFFKAKLAKNLLEQGRKVKVSPKLELHI